MGRSLVIVESPAKAKTINKYLGRNYTVKASYGHVMDLPKTTIGILLPGEQNGKGKKKKRKTKKSKGADAAPEKKAPKPVVITAGNIFEPTYQVIPGKIKVINDLRKAAQGADAIYLAGDPDREGEAICAHLEEILSNPREYSNLREETDAPKNGDAPKDIPKKETKISKASLAVPPIYRVMFNEITQKAIKAAFETPSKVNANLVDAQQARRVLDRIVGYKVSPLLWNKVRRGLSAGRVQTVALRLIVEREQEIRAFVPREYWTIHALLGAGEAPIFEAKLHRYKGEEIEVTNATDANRIVEEVRNAAWRVAEGTQKEKGRFGAPPLTPSQIPQAPYNTPR